MIKKNQINVKKKKNKMNKNKMKYKIINQMMMNDIFFSIG